MEPNNNPNVLTLGDVFRILKRRKITFIVVFLITVLLSIAYIKITPKVYEASLTFEMKNVSTASSLLSQYGSLASMVGINLGGSGGSSINNTIEKMKSDKILTRVIEKNNLVEYYNSNKNPSLIDKILGRDKEIKLRDIIESLKNDISINQQNGTSFLKISYQSTNPTLAASIVKSLYTEYLDYDKEEYFKDSNSYLSNLKKLYNPIEKQYMQIQKKILDFQVNNKILNEESITPYIDQYSKLYFSLIDIDSQKKQLEAGIKSIEESITSLNPEMKKFFIENTGTISTLKQQLINLKIEYETLKLTSSQNPKLLELESKINVIENNLKKQINDILSNNLKFLATTDPETYKEYISKKIQLELFDVMKQSTLAILNKIDSDIKSKSPLLYEYFQLKKNSKILEEKFTRLKTLIETEELKQQFYKPSLSIINDVYIPYKSIKPNKKIIFLGGIFLGFFLAIFSSFIKDAKDHTIKDIYEFIRYIKNPEFIITKSNYKNEIKKIANYIYINEYYKAKIGFTSVDYDDFTEIVEQIKNRLKKLSGEKEIDISILPEIDNPDFILHENEIEHLFIFIVKGYSSLENIEKYKEVLKENHIIYVENV
ncbi:uncharacterized protein involved in exopolysaccharide biosynthesis [Marinitoga piezophila KA3]|uniref:Uncharacterized protein involved in exopolysaccharide biosynthesis n=1 Tax=Marinitoga piezophila (strain DSM 14283 / JCM 11233 / KA3) TaxID=443254 RepID=H2J8E3_MARPK|nr:Wzz/FepE/Etk N-terminal domain-containing protein [Marinitoga piezophila]AEX85627.1 uncharacterized protein involved in exopolysaccharide biosynthesis [Marinitoga piezophila KA3]